MLDRPCKYSVGNVSDNKFHFRLVRRPPKDNSSLSSNLDLAEFKLKSLETSAPCETEGT